MNSKIKNYVDVLFNDIPMTRKAAELKEEILSTLNEHFEAHLAEGKSENQAYTEALSDMGDIDELLESLTPAVVGSTTIPRITSSAKTASSTAISRPVMLLKSSVQPKTAATAWITSARAGITDTQNCLFRMRTVQLIMGKVSFLYKLKCVLDSLCTGDAERRE